MLYLIVPPVIIVVASVILLFLLSRKGPEFLKKAAEVKAGKGLTGIAAEKKEAGYFRLKHLSLSLLEKATGEFKVLLFRFHSLITKWTNAIREKKNRYAAAMKKETPAEKMENEIARPSFVSKIEAPAAEAQPVVKPEKIPSPMISSRVVQPEVKREAKEEFEKILIERIAENPRDLEAYERLGKYYLEQNNYQDAKECYKQVLRLSPINRQARIKLNKITRILGH